MFITGKTKGGYLTRTEVKPAESDTAAFTQVGKRRQSSMILGDLNDLWTGVKEKYSTLDNSYALYEVESKLYNFKQGEMSVTNYYIKLARTWL